MEIQVMIERHRIEDRVDVAALEQRRQRRGKTQALAGARQVQRLDAEAVAGDEQALAVALPDGEGKHAVEFRQQRFAPGMETLEQHFGVATGIEGITQAFKFAAQFREVVDRAVEGQGQSQLIVDHRLRRTVRQVHDFQAAMAQGNRPLAVKTPGVGASRCQVMGDSLNGCKVCRLIVKT
ncbi:hypothetical protein D3C76_422010 [compost metagenome]